MVNVKMRLLLLVIFSMLIMGCVQHTDYLYNFHITGQVYDKQSNKPVSFVNIDFIDTGFDYARTKEHFKLSAGKSTADGKIDLDFNYFWGEKSSALSSKSKETFSIELSKENYERKRFDFKASEMKSKNNKIEVPLNNVFFETIQGKENNKE